MLTSYGRKKIGDHMLGKASYTMPTVYLALLASNPGDSGLQTSEMTFSGYARIEITSKMAAFTLGNSETSNSTLIDFGSPGANDNPIAYVAFMDASSSGNMIGYEALPAAKSVVNGGQPLRFAVGQLKLRLV